MIVYRDWRVKVTSRNDFNGQTIKLAGYTGVQDGSKGLIDLHIVKRGRLKNYAFEISGASLFSINSLYVSAMSNDGAVSLSDWKHWVEKLLKESLIKGGVKMLDPAQAVLP